MNIQKRSLFALYLSQFLGTFNDNLFKILVILIATRLYQDNPDKKNEINNLSQMMLILPYMFFSTYAGFMADKFAKSEILKLMKFFEVAVGCISGYFFMTENTTGLLLTVLLMGIHSAFNSPARYGIIPELVVNKKNISEANGTIDFFIFLGIVLGTAGGGFIMKASNGSTYAAGFAIIIVAVLGLISSLFIKKTEAIAPNEKLNINPVPDIIRIVKEMLLDKRIAWCVFGITAFWSIGAFLLPSLYSYAESILKLSEEKRSIFIAAMGVGIGIGSGMAGKISRGKVELGLVPIGAVIMFITTNIFYLAELTFSSSLVLCLILGGGSGLVVVPMQAMIQRVSPADKLGKFLGITNLVNNIGMVAATLLSLVLYKIDGITPKTIFGISGLIILALTILSFYKLPSAFYRCVNWIFVTIFYRVSAKGRANIPSEGPALIVANHVSYVDPSLVLYSVEEEIRFLMYKKIYENKLINPIAKLMRCIPVAAESSPRELIKSLKEARQALENGEKVCIFAEGELTRIGNLLPFNRGLEIITKDLDVPIIPTHIDQIWGSIFSFKGGKFFRKVPQRIPYHIKISFGKPLTKAKSFEVRAAVEELSTSNFEHRVRPYNNLIEATFYSLKKNPFAKVASDSSGLSLRKIALLSASTLIAKKLTQLLKDRLEKADGLKSDAEDFNIIVTNRSIGLLLPSSVAGAIGNIASTIAGLIPINLNFTAGESSINSAIKKSEITHVLTSKKFLEKALEKNVGKPLFDQTGINLIYFEEIFNFNKITMVFEVLKNLILPTSILAKLLTNYRPTLNSPQTVIFSSGSTGEPKGVVLSHLNVISNIEGSAEVMKITPEDCILGVLPFFHSFGYTITLWFPILASVKATYHYNPLETKIIGKISKENNVSILLATPTFLSTYTKKIKKEDLSNLRIIMVGAEKLRQDTADEAEKAFGVRPLEGFGCTELSPVAMVNTEDFKDENVDQIGTKSGSVGLPLPGISVKFLDPDTNEEVTYSNYTNVSANDTKSDTEKNTEKNTEKDTERDIVKRGLLLVKGPNVMLGYLKDKNRTEQVILNGYYNTGDIGEIDEDGFVYIKGRLSRFSKIAGEMVPHGKIEEEILRALKIEEQVIAVTGVSDEEKGEKIIVLHTIQINPEEITNLLKEAGLPNLWIPKKDSFKKVEAIPLLGTGKLDLVKIKKLAEE